MNVAERSAAIPVRLTAVDRVIDAQVVRARPNTLVVAFKPGEAAPEAGLPLKGAALDLNGRWIELGSCRLEESDSVPRRRREDPTPDVAMRRLVFKDRIYDFSG